MKKLEVGKWMKGISGSLREHSPQILTGFGIAGMVASTVLAVKATPKAIKLIEEASSEQELTKIETVKVAWKPYIPAAITATASVVCLIGANSVNTRRTAAIATAYKLSETALTEYKDTVNDLVGEKKAKTIREKIDKDRIEKNPVSKNDVIITEKGNTLCYDSISGRYFRSDIDKIKKAVNELNRRMVYDTYVSLNEFYDELDLDHTVVGDDLGWNLDGGLIEVSFTSQIADDGTPCIVVNYHVAPRYDFSRFT